MNKHILYDKTNNKFITVDTKFIINEIKKANSLIKYDNYIYIWYQLCEGYHYEYIPFIFYKKYKNTILKS